MAYKGVYIAGGSKNAGKTTVSLGLVNYFNKALKNGSSFIKPVGQKSTIIDGSSVGQDSYLLKTALNLIPELKYSAPFSSGSGAAEKFILTGEPQNIDKTIKKAYKHLVSKHELVIVEGTGHPGVGSVFNLSNGKIASMLNVPAILILDGGLGSTIDKFTLCESIFRKHHVKILGVIINRVREDKKEKVRKILDPWFASRGIPVFGYIPYKKFITLPSVSVVKSTLKAEPLYLRPEHKEILIPGYTSALGNITEIMNDISKNPDHVLVVSSSREDIINALIARRLSDSDFKGPSALLACGLQDVDDWIIKGCTKSDLPLLKTDLPPVKALNSISKKIFKVEPGENHKIEEILELVTNEVDMKMIQDHIQGKILVPVTKENKLFKNIVKKSGRILINLFKKKKK